MARCQGTVESLRQGLLDLDDDNAFGYLQDWPDLSAMCGANLGVPAVAAAPPSAGVDGNDSSSSSGSGGGFRKRRPDAYLDAKGGANDTSKRPRGKQLSGLSEIAAPGKGKQERPKAGTKKKAEAASTAAAAAAGQKTDYIHVRARRGQATDSHSLAERARREKINARMELLKELVPGCSKVSGTALVLDEIINHVQSLQRQVEYLSMRLAAVNPRVDFGGLDSFLTTECGRIAGFNCKNGIDLEQVTWPEMGVHGARQLMQLQQQFWHGDLAHPHQVASQWEKRGDSHPPVFSNSNPSLFGYDLTSSGAQQTPVSKLKTEL